jgi:hypothetical protein
VNKGLNQITEELYGELSLEELEERLELDAKKCKCNGGISYQS